jgi:hypothetical protein
MNEEKKNKKTKPVNDKRWLYSFSVNRTVEVEEKEKTTNDKGEDITVVKKVETQKPVTFAIKKPNRKLFDEGELFYGVALSEGIKAGLLTKALLAKRYENDGGSLSEPEKKRYSELYLEIFEKENELQKAQLNLENATEAEKKEKIGDILSEMAEMRRELQNIEADQSAIFDQTAENRAKNKTIMWWVLQLSHQKDVVTGTYNEVFEGSDYDSRLGSYDVIEEKDEDFLNEGVKKLAYFTSFWYSGQANTKEDFENIADYLKEQEDAYSDSLQEEDEESEENKEVAGEAFDLSKDLAEKKPAKKKTKVKVKVEEKKLENVEKSTAEESTAVE